MKILLINIIGNIWIAETLDIGGVKQAYGAWTICSISEKQYNFMKNLYIDRNVDSSYRFESWHKLI